MQNPVIEASNNQPFISTYPQLLINIPFSQIHSTRAVNNCNEIVNTSPFTDFNMSWPWGFVKFSAV